MVIIQHDGYRFYSDTHASFVVHNGKLSRVLGTTFSGPRGLFALLLTDGTILTETEFSEVYYWSSVKAEFYTSAREREFPVE